MIRGFRSAEFDLREEGTATRIFTWQAPDDADHVVCGLFVGEPDVRGGKAGRIVNARTVLYATHRFRIPSSADTVEHFEHFGFGDLERAEDPGCATLPALNSFSNGQAYPVVTTLLVGCWAFDSLGVIAATRLRNLKLADVPETKPPVSDCSGLTDVESRLCAPPVSIGLCRKDRCEAQPEPAAGGLQGEGGGGGDGNARELDGIPVLECMGNERRTCQLAANFRFGHCAGNRCDFGNDGSPELPLVVNTCSNPAGEYTDWFNCFDIANQRYGTCWQGACRQRCIAPSDCGDLGACVQLDRDHALVCAGDPTPSSLVGICVLRTEYACS